MLEIRNLSAKRGKKQVLEGINFRLPSKTITAVIGKNGSGKSTLCECINRTVAYSGDILFSGKELGTLAPTERARHISYLPQVHKAPHITVSELVEMGRTPHRGVFGHMSEEDRLACDEALDTIGAKQLSCRFADELSGGERQKAYLAMMLAQDTPVMMLDEPTANMDIAFEKVFYEMLIGLCENGKTMLVVMHDISRAVELASHIVLLDGGRLSFFGKTEECLACGAIERVFNVRRIEASGKSFFTAR